jgi:cobalt-zinc-cadmium efflux system protein
MVTPAPPQSDHEGHDPASGGHAPDPIHGPDHIHGPGHDHGHDHGHGYPVPASGRARTALWLTLGLNAAYLVAEVVGGIAFSSLSLLADAAHLGADVVGLGIALLAQALVTRPASDRHSFGLRRAEALGAQANALLLAGTTVWIIFEAVRRLGSPEAVDGLGLAVVAAGGVVVNVVGVLLIRRAGAHDLNMRGALMHLAADALGSLGALAAGIAVIAFGADRVDPAVSILIALLVLWAAWGLLRDTTHVLLEGTPRGLDTAEVAAALETGPGVAAVHHLHVWELASDMPALSAHVVLTDEPTLHEAQARGDALKELLAERFGIRHATLELECHECEDSDHPAAP